MLTVPELEGVWEALAESVAAAVAEAGPAGDRLMLAKLALLLAEALGDAPRVHALIRTAMEDLT